MILLSNVLPGVTFSHVLHLDVIRRQIDESENRNFLMYGYNAEHPIAIPIYTVLLYCVIDVVHGYCNKWRLKANVSKSAVMVFSKNSVEGGRKWGEHTLPKVSNYRFRH